jgi:hypothetical protein
VQCDVGGKVFEKLPDVAVPRLAQGHTKKGLWLTVRGLGFEVQGCRIWE